MAVFPQGNPGAVPLDPEDEIGQFRLLFGDTSYEEYDPAAPGQGNYKYFSDAEINALLIQGGGSTDRSMGFAFLQLAGAAAITAKSVKDFDLAINTEKRAAELRATAQIWFERADAADDLGGESDFFDVVGGEEDFDVIPEGLMPEYGRYYVRGRI